MGSNQQRIKEEGRRKEKKKKERKEKRREEKRREVKRREEKRREEKRREEKRREGKRIFSIKETKHNEYVVTKREKYLKVSLFQWFQCERLSLVWKGRGEVRVRQHLLL